MAARKKKHPESAAATLDEIESLSDRISSWISDNPAPILGTGLAILVIAGAYGFISSVQSSSRAEGSADLALAIDEYRAAMGASPNQVRIVEPANPETGRRVRAEYIERFTSLATQYEGSPSGALAALEAGALQQQLGEAEPARETWQAALSGLGSNDPIRALLLHRIGGSLEDSGQWAEAAQAYEDAAQVASYPLRSGALLDAARCRAEAGEAAAALAAFDRAEEEAPEQQVPEYLAARIAELRTRD